MNAHTYPLLCVALGQQAGTADQHETSLLYMAQADSQADSQVIIPAGQKIAPATIALCLPQEVALPDFSEPNGLSLPKAFSAACLSCDTTAPPAPAGEYARLLAPVLRGGEIRSMTDASAAAGATSAAAGAISKAASEAAANLAPRSERCSEPRFKPSSGLCAPPGRALSVTFGFLAEAGVAGRSNREGVLLAYAGDSRLTFALLFRERLFGALELPVAVLEAGIDALTPLLQDFRLGWFPGEKAERLGGMAAYAAHLPPEAEGFGPMFTAGESAQALTSVARVLRTAESGVLPFACKGLANAARLWRAEH